jgi:pyrophosphate--fructose-6-phosphate 1-phosphotransferase
MHNESLLEKARRHHKPSLPPILHHLENAVAIPVERPQSTLKDLFPHTHYQPHYRITKQELCVERQALRVGVVLSGGQAAGGHNVIIGLYDALKQLNKDSRLFGFLNGPGGIVKGNYTELVGEQLDSYRNSGGFDLIGSGRTKIEASEQFEASLKVVNELVLDGLVVIGGDDSNTNAALLAEYFRAHGSKCNVIGVPKTIDGDLRSKDIDISFGFDTACKTFSETIGNIARDALSAKKYWHFIKLMGRSASHITLECALQTHPNLALIGEEIADKGLTLAQVTQQISDIIAKRAAIGKSYGVILIPEGIIEFIPDCQQLIKELNTLLAKNTEIDQVPSQLSAEAKECFQAMPEEIQRQLLLDRDPHGNVQVSKIETERLFIACVEHELNHRSIKFNAQPHFLGYEGRSGFPSQFDCNYCSTLGFIAALLIDNKATGCIAYVRGIGRSITEWELGGAPLTTMIHLEERKGSQKPVIQKALVELHNPAFLRFARARSSWILEDLYLYPGPIQFFGPEELTNSFPLTLESCDS